MQATALTAMAVTEVMYFAVDLIADGTALAMSIQHIVSLLIMAGSTTHDALKDASSASARVGEEF